MLVRFSITNWKSFRSEATLSMVASRERQHGERIHRSNDHKLRILPIAVIFGGNASGKTNLLSALKFAKRVVVEGVKRNQIIPVEAFALDPELKRQPTCFGFELLIGDDIYEYFFSVGQDAVVEEKLAVITPTRTRLLYHRSNGQIKFSKALEKDQFIQFVFESTRKNQLFLTSLVNHDVSQFSAVYKWFERNLILIAPESRFEAFQQFLDDDSGLRDWMNDKLHLFDSGIARLGGEEVSLAQIPLTDLERSEVIKRVGEGELMRISTNSPHGRFIVYQEKGQLIAKKLVAYHTASDGSEELFDISRESSGTRRVIELLPAFLDLCAENSNNLFAIDEIDRSMHSQLVRGLIEEFLENYTATSRSQLFLTTHDSSLLDQAIFRRDEIWMTERDYDGNTQLFSLSEYKGIRFDKDIRRSYLEGRLGGVPHLMFRGTLGG